MDKGMTEKWYIPASATEGWKKVQIPKLWEETEIGDAEGIVWFKKDFYLMEAMEGKKAVLNLGPIDDADETFFEWKINWQHQYL
jgi:sialate O-acetylesterase